MPLRPSQGGPGAPTGAPDGDWPVLPAPPADFAPAVAGLTGQRPSPSKRIRVEEVDPASVSGLPDGADGSAAAAQGSDMEGGEPEPPEMADEDEEEPVLVDEVADQLPPTEDVVEGSSTTIPLTKVAAKALSVAELRDALKVRSLGYTGNKPDLLRRLEKHIDDNPSWTASKDGVGELTPMTPETQGTGHRRAQGGPYATGGMPAPIIYPLVCILGRLLRENPS